MHQCLLTPTLRVPGAWLVSQSASTMIAELAYGALVMAVAVRGGAVTDVIMRTRTACLRRSAGPGEPGDGRPRRERLRDWWRGRAPNSAGKPLRHHASRATHVGARHQKTLDQPMTPLITTQ